MGNKVASMIVGRVAGVTVACRGWMSRPARRRVTATLMAAALASVAAPGGAITFGQPDNGAHPNVGALVAEWRTPGIKEVFCSGVLVSDTVFLTAAHCVDGLEALGISHEQAWVTFDGRVTEDSELLPGRWTTHPAFTHRQSDPGDLAVFELQTPVSITPASLPLAGLLDQTSLRGQQFTAVGYGSLGPVMGGGPPVFPAEDERRFAVSEFRALNRAWLRLSQNPATGDGGTCSGDSGGPNFLGAGGSETDVVAALTVTGDIMCRATNVTLRLDTPSARGFLGRFVDLP